VAGEYATKFFREAYQRGGEKIARAFEAELNILTWSVRKDPDWGVLTTSPFYSLQDKEKTVRKKALELKLSPFFANRVVRLLNDQNDISRLEQLRTDFEEIMRFLRKERQVTLVTGKDLPPQEIDLLRESVKADYLRPEDTVVFSHQIDTSILGGYKVIIDGSETSHAWTNSDISEVTHKAREGALKQFPVPGKKPELKRFPDIGDPIKYMDPTVYSKSTIDLVKQIIDSYGDGEMSIGRFISGNTIVRQSHSH